MTKAEEFYAQLPFAIGESPWEIKGVGYVFHDQYVKELLPGGVEAQRAKLGALADDPFWGRLRLASGSYDLLPLVACGYACAEVMSTSMEDFVVLRARHQAQKDMTTLRRMLMSILSPATVAKRFPFLLKTYFNFGEPEAVAIDDGVRMGMQAVPAVLEPWLRSTCYGFVEHALESSGAKDIRIAPSRSPAGFDDAGRPLVEMRFEMRWR